MTDVRRFDLIEKVVRDMRRQLEDAIATIMHRLSSHVHGSGVEARYNHTANQSIPNATDTKIRFQTAITTCGDVTASLTGNQNFTLNRAGLWRVGVCLPWVPSSNSHHVSLQTGSTINHLNRFTMSAGYGNDTIANYCSADIRVTAGTVICAVGWQNTGAAVNTDSFFGGAGHIHFTWMRP